eukprot:TRINITY_DN34324_c0_g1_i2.p1 TRINITY_DN34324_c0_g1~~TRINITY_DN34324_c0_g1_i2.p1  ORF type:complete len:372 (-),score=74.65 TRINITY_DN34324_c0_g1_i2:43-1158(-)
MSVLLDAFDDAGLLDHETRSFLVEALVNADESDWQDIIEPFLMPVEPALLALKVPGVLQKSQDALEREEKRKEKKDQLGWMTVAFTKAMSNGTLSQALGLHTASQCNCLCKAVRGSIAACELWHHGTARACRRWRLAMPTWPAGESSRWREHYFSLLRPRCDGIYVGECGYRRWVRVGHHMDMRKNGAALAAYGGRGGSQEWVAYRRYLRFLPESEDGECWALVLQDPCSRKAAEQVLLSPLDPRTHENPAKIEGSVMQGTTMEAWDPDRLRSRICAARYDLGEKEGELYVRYRAADEESRMTFSLSHGAPHTFASRLIWEHYEKQVDGQDALEYDLNRLPDWKGGGRANEDRDDFAQMDFRPKVALEHLC